MPRGKKATTVGTGAGTAPANVVVDVSSSSTGKTKLDTLLFRLRNTCRTHGLQSWNKQSLCDQIYQELLFLYHLPRLVKEGSLELDCESISDGKLTSISYATLLTLKGDPPTMSNVFKRLWRALQTSFVASLFRREFAMFSIEKDEKKTSKYYKLLVALFEDMNSVELTEYDSNAGYTYFKKELNKGTAKTFGQFYTPNSVLKSVVHLVNPLASDLVLDPSCGSCSFLQETAKYIAATQNVDARIAFQNLYGIEVERDIYTEGIMNIFINFGIIPDMETHVQEEDAFLELLKTDTRFDKIVANPPFGATVNSFKEFYFQTVHELKGTRTVKKVIVNPAVKNTIPFPDIGESAILFFQMIVQVLKTGGRAGVVMSSTILNDSYSGVMEWFLNCCSLDKVVINPAGTFKEQGTMIETLSFLYTKGSPTTTISVVMLGDEDTVIRTITLDQAREAGWKLNVKGTEGKKTEESSPANPAGFPMVKLEDVLTDHPVKNPVATTTTDGGAFSLFSSSCDIFKHSVAEFSSRPYLLQGSRGTISKATHYCETPFSASNNVFVLSATDTSRVSLKFVYYFLRLSNIADQIAKTSVIPALTKTMFREIKMPLPPRTIQDEIVATLDRIYAPGTTDLADTIKITNQAMDLVLATPSGATLEPIVEALRLIRKSAQMVADVKAQMAALMKSVGSRGFPMVKLGDILTDHPVKKPVSTTTADGGAFSLFSSSCDIFKHSVAEFSSRPYLLQGSRGTISKATHYCETPFSASNNVFVLSATDTSRVFLKFVYYFLRLNNVADQTATNSVIPMLTKTMFREIKMPLPPLEFQTAILARLAALESQLAALETLQRQSEDNARFILESYLSTAPPSAPLAGAGINVITHE